MTEESIPKFNRIATKWYDDAFAVRPSEVPEVLYHYTDAAGLLGIFEGGRVWATHCRFLNDTSEIGYSKAMVRSLIQERLNDDKMSKFNSLYSSILRYQEVDAPDDVFLFSLSAEQDDLSQWRGYAREGQGFTVGFDARRIYELSKPTEAPFGFCKVDYSPNTQYAAFSEALKEFEDALSEDLDGDGDVEEATDDAALQFDWLVENRAPKNKHKSFRSENEWRLMAVIREKDRKQIKVRASGLNLVKYIPIALASDPSQKLPILRIGIGPGFSSGEIRSAVSALCASHGYEPEIYAADTPYRRS